MKTFKKIKIVFLKIGNSFSNTISQQLLSYASNHNKIEEEKEVFQHERVDQQVGVFVELGKRLAEQNSVYLNCFRLGDLRDELSVGVFLQFVVRQHLLLVVLEVEIKLIALRLVFKVE
jgi:hypothetical protein